MKTYYIPCDCFAPKMIVASAVTGYTCFGCPMGSLPFLVNSSKPYYVDANATFNFFEVRADKDFVCLADYTDYTDYTNRIFTPTTECDGWEVCPAISKPSCVLSYARICLRYASFPFPSLSVLFVRRLRVLGLCTRDAVGGSS